MSNMYVALDKRCKQAEAEGKLRVNGPWFNPDKSCAGDVTVMEVEEYIFQDRLWLHERNDELAKKLFVEWYNKKLATLKEQV